VVEVVLFVFSKDPDSVEELEQQLLSIEEYVRELY
jgi:hypothetical protein